VSVFVDHVCFAIILFLQLVLQCAYIRTLELGTFCPKDVVPPGRFAKQNLWMTAKMDRQQRRVGRRMVKTGSLRHLFFFSVVLSIVFVILPSPLSILLCQRAIFYSVKHPWCKMSLWLDVKGVKHPDIGQREGHNIDADMDIGACLQECVQC